MNILNSSLVIGLISSFVAISSAQAGGRYAAPPNTVLSSNLTAPWLLQMNNIPSASRRLRQRPQQVSAIANTQRSISQHRVLERNSAQRHAVAIPQNRKAHPSQRKMSPQFLPQIVNYESKHKAGTIIISTNNKYLYLVMGNGQARRYGVGVGKKGFTWSGTQKITRKAEWPGWTPPAEMIAREKKKGRILPAHMPGGPKNPLGARALYLGSTMYRIHGTTQPWSIGLNISSGCIRMRNEDVTDLYQRVRVGTKVVVL